MCYVVVWQHVIGMVCVLLVLWQRVMGMVCVLCGGVAACHR